MYIYMYIYIYICVCVCVHLHLCYMLHSHGLTQGVTAAEHTQTDCSVEDRRLASG